MYSENARVYMVLDPQNSDAGFNPVEEAEVWIVDEKDEQMTHTGSADDAGLVEGKVKVNDLIDACVGLFDDYEYSGKVAVVDSDKLMTLQLLLRRLDEDV